MATSKGVWLLLERETLRLGHFSLSLIREGKRLSDQLGGDLCAVRVGPPIENIGAIAGSHGIKRLYCYRENWPSDPGSLASSIATLLSEHDPCLFLSVSSSFGSDLMPRIAAKLRAPLVTNCLDIAVTEGIEFAKAVQGGKRRATVRSVMNGLQMATVNPEMLPVPEELKMPQVAEIIDLPAPPVGPSDGIRYKEFLKADHRKVDIREAEFVVAVGKGIGTKENCVAIEKFADMIGAAIGGSRPAVDIGIVPYERQVGQTGKKISPKLIILCGISGSEYFMQGIEPGTVKIAINTDRKAPVFAQVDLGIVADATDLIPKVLEHLSK
jgi:electron transfer flavoprotein alpha subunit